MAEEFEIQGRAFEEKLMKEARKTTLARAEHVWVRHESFAGVEWLPAVLAGWERHQRYGLVGRVVVVAMRWDGLKKVWKSDHWDELVDKDRIRKAERVRIAREPS